MNSMYTQPAMVVPKSHEASYMAVRSGLTGAPRPIAAAIPGMVGSIPASTASCEGRGL